MIDWVFLDVGSVLFNDAPQDYQAMRFFHEAIARKDSTYSFQKMLAEREELAREGAPLILGQIAARYLSPEEIRETYVRARQHLFTHYDDHNLPFPDAAPILEELSKEFQLGIIANQPVECRESLRRRDLLRFFQVVAISDELQMRKPDLPIFHWALEQAKAPSDRSVMVGDRTDNDVVPARAAGMRTIWLDWPHHQAKNWFPDENDARLFLASCDAVPFYGARPQGGSGADQTVNDLRNVPAAVKLLVERGEYGP